MKKLLYIIFMSSFLYGNDTIVIKEDIEDEKATEQVSEITEDEIEALKASTTGELVSNIPGIKLSKAGSRSQGAWISIRGSSPEQVLVLLNGRRLNSSQGGGVNLNSIPVESIKKIEVIRGGGSAKFGGSAFGGVINIITTGSDYNHIRGGYKLDSLLGNSGYFGLSKSISKSLSLEGSITGNYDEGVFRDNSQLKSIHSDGNISVALKENHSLKVNGNFYFDDKGVPGSKEFPSDSSNMNDSFLGGGISYTGNNITGDIFYINRERTYRDPDYPLGKIYSYHNYKSLTSEVKGSFKYMDTSLSYSYDYLESTSYDENSVDRYLLSLSASPKAYIKNFKIEPSGRVDYLDFKESLFSWNLGVVGTVKDGVEVNSNLGTAYRLPGFDDLFWPEGAFAKGNPDLTYEKGTLFDIGSKFMITDSLSLSLVYFYNWIEDLIIWNPGPGGVWSPGNLGFAEVYGFESEISYLFMSSKINGFIEGRLNYTYLSALNKSDGVTYNKMLINRTEHKGNFIAIYRNFNNWLVTMDLSYIGDRYLTMINSKKSEGYTLLDLSTTFPIYGEFTLSLYAKNLLNYSYEDYRGFPVPGITFGGEISYRRDLYE